MAHSLDNSLKVQNAVDRVSLPDGARWRSCYYAFGRRIQKMCKGQLSSAQAVAWVVHRWDGDQFIGQQQYRVDDLAACEAQQGRETPRVPCILIQKQKKLFKMQYMMTMAM
ncbi:hypothetical protein [Pectobacterium sp. B1J-3]|uniref:hypothetical protein n=1 Tax=Pectobacterium sp. B1J-3 TaxID=3385371 RepID=UPI0039069273